MARTTSTPGRRGVAGPTVHRLKITLRGSRPPIWRRLEVPSDCTLEQLHHVIQAAFGWEGYHAWVFETPVGEFGPAGTGLGHRDAGSRRLDQAAACARDRLRYTYDFGDDWEHDIVTETITGAQPGSPYPRCVAGRRARPPEDCGGIWGYERLLEILADPGHEEHDQQVDWLGLESADSLDPGAFDLAEVNHALSPLTAPDAR